MDWLLAMKVAQILSGTLAIIEAVGYAKSHGEERDKSDGRMAAICMIISLAILTWAVLT